jgi:hypothetical protein
VFTRKTAQTPRNLEAPHRLPKPPRHRYLRKPQAQSHRVRNNNLGRGLERAKCVPYSAAERGSAVSRTVVLRCASPLFGPFSWAIIAAISEESCMSQAADHSTRECENCHVQMVQLGKLPASLTKQAVRVFRCYGCNAIKAEPM